MGSGSLLSSPQVGLQGLLLAQQGPLESIALGLLGIAFAWAAAACFGCGHKLQHSHHAGGIGQGQASQATSPGRDCCFG